MRSTPQWADAVDGSSKLSKSFTAGCEFPYYPNYSPQPPAPTAQTKGSPSMRTPDCLRSLIRFRTQAKDQFVVRVVKITDKSSSWDPMTKQEAQTASSRLDVTDQEDIPRLLKQPGTSLFVGFQAQMPAMSSEYVSRSTSADQVNNERSSQNHSLRRRKVGKGVRLCFSCLLKGNGPQIEDFYKGVVSQRLEAWEKSSGRPGLLLEVLTALQKTVENILKQVRLDGLRTILPEEDYVFYPLRSDGLQRACRYSKIASYSEECLEGKTQQKPDLITEPSSPVQICAASFSQHSLQGTSSPILVPNQGQPPEYRGTLPLTNRRNQNLLSALVNSRPVSAYGTIFGNTGKSPASEMQYFLSASGMSPQSRMSDRATYDCLHRNEHSHISLLNRLSPDFCPNCLMCESPCGACETPGNVYASHAISEFPVFGREGEFLPLETARQCAGQAYSPNGSQRIMASAVQQNKENPLDVVIKEIAERLRTSPHLPLVVMPTQLPTASKSGASVNSPSSAFTDKAAASTPSTGVPLVFQLSNPDVIFVGLPAVGSDRPRLVTSPADSAFVVASRRVDEVQLSALPQQPQTLPPSARYTVASPKPGYLLAVSSEGGVYQIPDTYNFSSK
ncbi:hypothetical protein AAHC03_0771 [Spirometra sp. Aus1]